MVVRGVPKRLAKDAWWLDGAGPRRASPVWLLFGALVCADQLVWGSSTGLGVVVWVLILAAAMHLAVGAVEGRRAAAAWALLVIALVPAVDLVQVLSVMFLILGLLGFAALMIAPRWDVFVILRAMARLPGYGVMQNWRDAKGARVAIPSRGAVKGVAFDWLLPLGVGTLFVLLMAVANPLVDQWIARLGQFESGVSLNIGRVAFWGSVALLVWPLLRLTAMAQRLILVPTPGRAIWRSGLVNDRSVLRALVIFNLIFAVQSLLDLGYLWAGVALPEGMTYAQYAHRGAYPLLVTALLAGLFALLSQPYLEGRALLRGLLYLWVAQTVLLVLSSILRLDLYVDAYGLTRLRFAAFIWMTVVALGLVLMIMQMMGRQSVGWFSLRAAGLGLLALYACALVNVDGLIARTNLQREKPDVYYICWLSEGAAPAIAAYGPLCHSNTPTISRPQDWREWGFRNARLRRSLGLIAAEVQQ